MTTLQLSPRQNTVYALFKAKARRTLVELRVVYEGEDMHMVQVDKALTSVLFVLNAKLQAAKKGSVKRVSPRGRGHIGVYVLKRR